jgi:HSP20 family protein
MLRFPITFGRRSDLARADHPFLSFQREMNRLFQESFHSEREPTFLAPAMDIKETDQAIEILAELPGVDEKDINVSVEDGILTVKGEKKAEKEEKKGDLHLSERTFGSFLRRLELPGGIDLDKFSANFSNGVLKVTMPKRTDAAAKAKKIEIKTTK